MGNALESILYSMRTKYAGRENKVGETPVKETEAERKARRKGKVGRDPDVITPKQQRFIDAYDGDATAAAEAAGMGTNKSSWRKAGHHTIHIPKIVRAIKARQSVEKNPKVAGRKDRQEFWTRVMLDTNYTLNERMKASELLAKSEGDFLERVVQLNVETKVEKGDNGKLRLAPVPTDEEVKQTAAILLAAVAPGLEVLPKSAEQPKEIPVEAIVESVR